MINQFKLKNAFSTLSRKIDIPKTFPNPYHPQKTRVRNFSFISKDSYSRNKRTITILNNNKGYIINSPDGREIGLVQDDLEVFKAYAEEIGFDLGMEPNPDTINAFLGYNPMSIKVLW